MILKCCIFLFRSSKKRKALPSEITRLLQDPELCLIDEEEERQEEHLVLYILKLQKTLQTVPVKNIFLRFTYTQRSKKYIITGKIYFRFCNFQNVEKN